MAEGAQNKDKPQKRSEEETKAAKTEKRQRQKLKRQQQPKAEVVADKAAGKEPPTPDRDWRT